MSVRHAKKKRVIWEKGGGLSIPSFLPFYFRVRALFSISPNPLSRSLEQAANVNVYVPMSGLFAQGQSLSGWCILQS